MSSATCSQSKTDEDPQGDFLNQNLVRNPEPCSFFQLDIDRIQSSNAFPEGTIFKPFDPTLHPDHYSKKWEMTFGEPSKPRVPSLCSSIKKKKNNEVINVDESLLPLDFDEAAKNINTALGQMTKFFNEKTSIIEDLKKVAAAKAKVMEKDAAKIAKLRKEVEDLKAEHCKEMEDFLVDVKRDATVVIYEARIKISWEVAAKGFDASIWDTQTWRTKLAELKGDDLQGMGLEEAQAVAATMEVVKEVESTPVGDEGKI